MLSIKQALDFLFDCDSYLPKMPAVCMGGPVLFTLCLDNFPPCRCYLHPTEAALHWCPMYCGLGLK